MKEKKAILPEDAEERKAIPLHTGCINYFPLALAAVAKLSLKGGLQHGQTASTLHWDRAKSGDELDAMMRHIVDGDWDAVAWRALAHLQKTEEIRPASKVPNVALTVMISAESRSKLKFTSSKEGLSQEEMIEKLIMKL